jgi:hypothetical protein
MRYLRALAAPIVGVCLCVILTLTTDPELAVDIDRVRWYRNPNRHDNAPVYRGVTSVTGALPKPALLAWKAWQTARYAVDNKNAWLNMPDEEAIEWLGQSTNRETNRAAAKGTTVHTVIEKMLRGENFDVEARVAPWIGAAQAFVDDFQPEPGLTERTIFNDKHRFGGTFDFKGRMRRAKELGVCLVDWKTSKGVYPDMGVQIVGGYGLGAEYYLEPSTSDSGYTECEWVRPDTALIVHLTPGGYSVRPVPMDDQYRRAFLACLEIRKWEQEGPKIGDPYEVKADYDQQRFEAASLEAEVRWLKKRIATLTPEQRMELQLHVKELGMPTRLTELSAADVDRVLGLVRVYEMAARRDRPMA